MRDLMLDRNRLASTIPAFDEHILFALERRYFEFLDLTRLELCYNPSAGKFDFLTDLRMIKLNEVSHEGDPDLGIHLMQFQNVLTALHDDGRGGEPSHNVVSMIHNRGNNTSLYYGLAKRKDVSGGAGTGELFKLLGRSLHGNFLGTRFREMASGELEAGVCAPLASYERITTFPGIPSPRDRQGPYVQGIDRFIEAMRGEEYALLCIAEPIKLAVTDGMIANLFSLSSEIHSQVRATAQTMKGSSDTINMGMFGMKGIMDSATESESYTTGDSEARNYMGSGGLISASGPSVGAGIGALIGTLCFPGVGTIAGAAIGSALGAVIGPAAGGLASYALGMPMGTTASTMSSFTRTIANTVGSTLGGGAFGGYARGWNRSRAVTQEMLNKTAEHCEKLCDNYISRLQRGKNLGLWNVGVYLLARDAYTQVRGQGLLRSCLAGDETYWEPIRALPLQDDAAGAYLLNFNNPRYNLLRYGAEVKEIKEAVGWGSRIADAARRFAGGNVDQILAKIAGEADAPDSAALLEEIRRAPAEYSEKAVRQAWDEIEKRRLGHPLGPAMGGVSTPMNTEELSIVMNVPRREVQGVTIRKAAAFGVNYTPDTGAEHMEIGRFIHKRQVLEDLPFTLPIPIFQKHAFVCGVTGSGKTNTCFSLLKKAGLPFMVVEPAKGEYRRLLRDIPDLQVYTLGDETISPFRFNPFAFPYSADRRDGRLLFHIDAVKSAFNAAFPMYGPMAYILEEAIVSVYRDNGWDLAVSDNAYLKRLPAEEREGRSPNFLPTLRDLYNKVQDIVAKKRYAPEQTMNIEAALKARLSSLLTGSKGLMLDTRRSTPLAELLNRKVILELKHMGDDDEKCFIMGLILGQIYSHREAEKRNGMPLRHLLLVEEAHRLFKKVPEYVSPETGNTRGKAVETFCNVLSEIRDYGEGVIIVDQIPAKLAADAVKNTSVKIVHRTLASDDRDLLAGTMSLTPEQSDELPLLPVGQAVIHSEGADKPFLVRIDKNKDQTGESVADDEVAERMAPIHSERPDLFRRYPGFEKNPAIPQLYRCLDFEPLRPEIYAQIIAAVGIAVRGDVPLGGFREMVNTRIRDLIRCDNDLETDCHVIWNVNLFFEKLSEAFPRSIDYCQDAHQAFVDLWFGAEDETARRQALVDAMKRIVRGMPPVTYLAEAFLPYFASYSGHSLREFVKGDLVKTPGPEKDARTAMGIVFHNVDIGSFADALLERTRARESRE